MTLIIAIWGAALATVTFIWNIWKWRQESPRIDATIEAVESFTVENTFSGIRIILRNRGGQKTTIEQIFLYQRSGWFTDGLLGFLLRLSSKAFSLHNIGVSNPKTVKVPHVIEVNGYWEGFIPLEANDSENEQELEQIDFNRHISKSLHSSKLRFLIQCSHTRRNVRGLVTKEEIFPRV